MEDSDSPRSVIANGALIRHLRKEKGLTLEGFAEAAGIGRRTLQRVEASDAVDMESVQLCANALDVDYSILIAPHKHNSASALPSGIHEVKDEPPVVRFVAVQLTIGEDFKTWEQSKQNEILDVIRSLIGVATEILVVSAKGGSVILHALMAQNQAREIVNAVKNHHPSLIKIKSCEIVSARDLPADILVSPLPDKEPVRIDGIKMLEICAKKGWSLEDTSRAVNCSMRSLAMINITRPAVYTFDLMQLAAILSADPITLLYGAPDPHELQEYFGATKKVYMFEFMYNNKYINLVYSKNLLNFLGSILPPGAVITMWTDKRLQ